MSMVLLGALSMLAGIVFIAVREIYAGRLSSAKRGVGGVPPSLEPQRQGSLLNPAKNWPGYILIAAGAVILLFGGFV
jgi:hypothetical protein